MVVIHDELWVMSDMLPDMAIPGHVSLQSPRLQSV